MVKVLLYSILLMVHPVHVSLLSIDYAQERKIMNVFLKIYYDDFLIDSGIGAIGKGKQDSLISNTNFKNLILKYANEKIGITINNKLFYTNLEEYILSDNELTMNLSFKIDEKISSVTVKNLLMTNLYNDQTNMIIVKINDFEEGSKLTTDKTEQTFKIR
jgi:hypothetical protein